MAPRAVAMIVDDHSSSSNDDGPFGSVAFAGPLQAALGAKGLSPPSPRSCLRKRNRAATTAAPRSVRFSDVDQVLNAQQKDNFYTDEDIAIKWWNFEQLCLLKENAKDMAYDIRKSTAKPTQCPLSVAHKKMSLMLSGDFKILQKLPKGTPDMDLLKWVAFDDGRRGLERFSSKEYSSCRRKDVAATRNLVLDEQERQWGLLDAAAVETIQEKSLDEEISEDLSVESRAPLDHEAIAKIAREASRRSRTFALFLGEADSRHGRSLWNDDDSQPTQQRPQTTTDGNPAVAA